MKRGPYKYSKIPYEKSRELREKGYGYRTIAAKLDNQISWGTIRNWVRDITSEMREAHKLSEDLFKRPYKSFDEILKMPTRRHYLVRGRGHRCEVCLNENWLDKKIPLELDHINGDRNDNSKQNLRLICPNCHAFTDTYKGKNKKKNS